MMRRVRDFLRRRLEIYAPAPPLRPNELRRDVVQAERQRRDSRRVPAAGPRVPFDEATAPRQRPAVAPVQPATANPVLRGLQTRAGLRQAWLMAEILREPVAMRRFPHEDREV